MKIPSRPVPPEPEIPIEVRELLERVRRAEYVDDLAPVTIATEYSEPGTEPLVMVFVGGLEIVALRRDDFLDAMYVAGCDAIEAEHRRRAN